MIQRIQSIFLFLAGALGIAALFLPVSHFYKGFQFPINIEGLVQNYPFMITGGLLKIAGLISLVAIFLYRNRKRQINIVRFAQLLLVALLAYAVYMFYPFTGIQNTNTLLPAAQKYITEHWAFWMPLAMLLLNALGIFYIRKDDNLVRSSNRLR